MIKITGTKEELDNLKEVLLCSGNCFWHQVYDSCLNCIGCEECIEKSFDWEEIKE